MKLVILEEQYDRLDQYVIDNPALKLLDIAIRAHGIILGANDEHPDDTDIALKLYNLIQPADCGDRESVVMDEDLYGIWNKYKIKGDKPIALDGEVIIVHTGYV